jgi:hypothetical protein
MTYLMTYSFIILNIMTLSITAQLTLMTFSVTTFSIMKPSIPILSTILNKMLAFGHPDNQHNNIQFNDNQNTKCFIINL